MITVQEALLPEPAPTAPATAAGYRFGSNMVIISGIPSSAKCQDVIPVLSFFGTVEICELSPAGYGFVKYTGRFAASDAVSAYSGQGKLTKEVFPLLAQAGMVQTGGRVRIHYCNPQGDYLCPLSHDDKWSEHLAPDGSSYYYDCENGVSQWPCPVVLRAAAARAGDPRRCPFPAAGPIASLGNPVLLPHSDTNIRGSRSQLLFVAQLPYSWSPRHIREIFSSAGLVQNIWLQRDNGDRSRGYGWVLMASEEEAANAVATLDCWYGEERTICVERVRLDIG